MRIMIVAGEASGDLHGAGVVREVQRLRPGAELYGIGGDKMQAAGLDLVYHIRELSVMGFWEVVRQLPVLRSVDRTLTALLAARRPDAVVLIDYPGFNLRFARKAHARGIPVAYYISPQVWAWNPGRVRAMKGIVDKMLVVFPFEERIYRDAGIDVEFVGHPLLEVVGEPQDRAGFCTRHGFDPAKQIVGLFPGSRKQEVERIFPVMLGAARMLHARLGTETAVGVAPVLDGEYMRSFVREDFPVRFIHHAAYDLMANAELALVTSGTATLETACFRTPMIVVYKTSWPTFALGKALIRIGNIGLVNIVAGKTVVPELIQRGLTPQRLAATAAELLQDAGRRREIAAELAAVRGRLGTPGASSRAAAAVCALAERS